MPISSEDMQLSYRRMLMARIQEREFASWGGEIIANCRRVIAEHERTEAAYIDEQIIERRKSSDDMKAKLG